MDATFSTLRLLWPFLKEMILGKKTLPEALKTNKLRVVLLFVVSGSLGANYLLLPKLFDISTRYIEIEKENKELSKENLEMSVLRATNVMLENEAKTAGATQAQLQNQVSSLIARNTELTAKLIQWGERPNVCAPPPRRGLRIVQDRLEEIHKDE